MNNPGILELLRTQSGFSQLQVVEYLGISLSDYLRYTEDVNTLPVPLLESLAALYHVEEYDILTGTAQSQTLTGSPIQEKELIPFFRIVHEYMKMVKLLKEAENDR